MVVPTIQYKLCWPFILAFIGLWVMLTSFAQAGNSTTSILFVAPHGLDGVNECQRPLTPCATLQHALLHAPIHSEIWLAHGTYRPEQPHLITQPVTIKGGFSADFSLPPSPDRQTLLDGQDIRRMFFVSQTAVTLSHLTFQTGNGGMLNGKGGGIWVVSGTLNVQHSTFISNQAQFGGAIALEYSDGQLSHNRFEQNRGGYGGAVYVRGGSPVLQENQFVGNHALTGGGAVRVYDSPVTLQHNHILSNTSGLHGAGVYLSVSPALLAHNLISGNINADGWGGGVHLHRSPAQLVGNEIGYNQAVYGGGLRLFQSNAILTGNMIHHNQPEGIRIDGDSQPHLLNQAITNNMGDGLLVVNAQPHLWHTTFADNAHAGLAVQKSGTAVLSNTLMHNQPVGFAVNGGGMVTATAVFHSLITTPTQGGMITQTAVYTGEALLDGWQSLPQSPHLDLGVATPLLHDINGDPRTYGLPDMGADEFLPLQASQTALVADGWLTYTLHITNVDTLSHTFTFTNHLSAIAEFTQDDTLNSGESRTYLFGTVWQPIYNMLFTDTVVLDDGLLAWQAHQGTLFLPHPSLAPLDARLSAQPPYGEAGDVVTLTLSVANPNETTQVVTASLPLGDGMYVQMVREVAGQTAVHLAQPITLPANFTDTAPLILTATYTDTFGVHTSNPVTITRTPNWVYLPIMIQADEP